MAKKILVASHGKFAGGLQSSIDILTGQGSSLQVINAYLDDRTIPIKFKLLWMTYKLTIKDSSLLIY